MKYTRLVTFCSTQFCSAPSMDEKLQRMCIIECALPQSHWSFPTPYRHSLWVSKLFLPAMGALWSAWNSRWPLFVSCSAVFYHFSLTLYGNNYTRARLSTWWTAHVFRLVNGFRLPCSFKLKAELHFFSSVWNCERKNSRNF